MWNTRLGTDHHQLIMPPISKDCSNTFLERSFIYAAPCEWNKLSEHIGTSNFDCFKKSVKTMLFTQQIREQYLKSYYCRRPSHLKLEQLLCSSNNSVLLKLAKFSTIILKEF